MKKLLLLILLIPVLSWADCPTPLTNVFKFNQEWLVKNGGQQYIDKVHNQANVIHCEMHRCSEIKVRRSSCVCKNLGGWLSDRKHDWCRETPLILMEKNGVWSSFVNGVKAAQHYEKKQTPKSTTSLPRVLIDDAKKQCDDIGFKAGTEKFGECVLELMQ